MIIKTAIKPEEDLDRLCNSLNAEAGRFLYSDPGLRNYLLRAQAAISSLCDMKGQEEPIKIKSGHIDEYFGRVAFCPICENSWIMGDDSDLHFCPSCGKSVEWDE